MKREITIEALCMGDLTVKVKHSQVTTRSINFETGTQRVKNTDVFEYIYEVDGRQEKTQIPKRLYNALVAFENQQ